MLKKRRTCSRPDGPAGAPRRRTFLLGGLSAALLAGRPARADLRIGLVNPPGPLAPSILRGAQLGIAEADALAQMFGKKIELATPSVPASERVADVASSLIKEGVVVLVGGGDEPAAEALREATREGKALFLNVGSASDRLRSERCHRHAFHVHASRAMLAGAAALWLGEEKKLRRWAVLTGSDEVRSLVAALAQARGASVLDSAPAAGGTADWRPTLEQLGAAAPEALWLALPAANVAGFLRQFGQAGLTAELVVLAQEGVGLPTLEPGVASGVWPLAWHHTLERYSARELNNRHRRRFAEPLDSGSWSAWAALKMIGEAMLRQGATPQALVEYLEGDPPFDGHKGRPLTFRKSDHQLRQPLYLAQRRKASPAQGAGPEVEVVAEVPRGGGDLDAIFPPSQEGVGCLAS